MSRLVPLPAALLLPVVLAGCPHNKQDDFPLSVGYQPLTYCPQVEVAWPVDTAVPPDPCPEIWNVAAAPGCGGLLNPDMYVITSHAHLRGFLKGSLVTVWSKMQPVQDGLPNWVHLCDDGTYKCVNSWHWLGGTETGSFPVSFRMLYHVDNIISVDWEHTWREGPLAGTVAAPSVVGARYQKTWGIQNIRVQTGSFVLTSTQGDTCTQVELVGWLDGDTQGQTPTQAVQGTLVYAYTLLQTGVHTR